MTNMRHSQTKNTLFMRWLSILIISMLIASTSQPSCAKDLPTYTKQVELGPIVLSYSDVDQLVTSLKGQIDIANGRAKSGHSGKMSLSVEAGEDKISVNSWKSLSDAKRLPELGKRLSFDYSSYDSPVERVEISLNDYQRRILIEGTDRGQIDAIYAYIKDALSRRVWPWQGPLLRYVCGSIAFVISIQLVWLPIAMRPLFLRFYDPARIMFIQALGVLIMIALFALPWDTLLPGFAVYSSTDNTDRIIGLVGLALAIPALFMGWLRPRPTSVKQSARKSANANANSDFGQ